jgi:uncharacterized membrane protein
MRIDSNGPKKQAVFIESLLSTYWFVPAIMCMGAFALSLVTLWVDHRQLAHTSLPQNLVITSTTEGARALLSTIASSAITVAGVAFSITIVALTVAASQFGPRLLSTFIRDRGNQIVLGTFTSTFVYCIMIMRGLHGPAKASFDLHTSLMCAVIFSMLSIGMLIYFIHHICGSLEVETILGVPSNAMHKSITTLFPRQIGKDGTRPMHIDREAAGTLSSLHTGYVRYVDGDELMAIARANDLILEVVKRPGDFCMKEEPLVRHFGPQTGPAANLRAAVNACFVFGKSRTPIQDVKFSAAQLVEIALRALSPGMNDLLTATSCIDELGARLAELLMHSRPSPFRADIDGKVRLIAEPVCFEELLEFCFGQIAPYACSHSLVITRMMNVMAMLAQLGRTKEDLRAIKSAAMRIQRQTLPKLHDEEHRLKFGDSYSKTMANIQERETELPYRGPWQQAG